MARRVRRLDKKLSIFRHLTEVFSFCLAVFFPLEWNKFKFKEIYTVN